MGLRIASGNKTTRIKTVKGGVTLVTGATGADPLPSGGVDGEVLSVVTNSPQGIDWVNALDGGTFN